MSQVAEAVIVLADLALALNVKSIKDLGKPWVYSWKEGSNNWSVAVNGLPNVQTAKVDGWEIKLEPYHCAAWRNGWLLGLFSPAGGTFMGANGVGEDWFIDAVKARTLELTGENRL